MRREGAVKLGALAMGVALFAKASTEPSRVLQSRVEQVYLAGETVKFTAEPATLLSRAFQVGSWHFGRRIHDPKPRDHRLNLYIVAPGRQYKSADGDPLAFNCVINALPTKPGAEVEWDVYWAAVLDPDLGDDLTNEHDLLLDSEAEFTPGPELRLDQVPGRELLTRYLRLDAADNLERYRRASGRLPRLVILPSHIVLRARAEKTVPVQVNN